ncbi:MAG: hypothetical protein L6Q69_17790 [Zoogloea sp.]|nr:hypothetical protein [Zoogloea sp.]
MTKPKQLHVVLRGPEWEPGKPFWRLHAAAPDPYVKGNGHRVEDHVHPLRVQLMDAVRAADSADNSRRPHALSLHLLIGHGQGKYATEFGDWPNAVPDKEATKRTHPNGFEPLPGRSEAMSFRPFEVQERLDLLWPDSDAAGGRPQYRMQSSPSRRKWRYRKTPGGDDYDHQTAAYFASGPLAAKPDTPANPLSAAFQHVLVEPLLPVDHQWPAGKKDYQINLPEFGLLAGTVQIAVADGAFSWLGKLQPQPAPRSTKEGIQRYALSLTPEGIELDCAVSFPGAAEPLDGRFLLAPQQGHLTLTLLPEALSPAQRTIWLRAWQAVLPSAASAEVLHGFRVECDASAIPAFRWHLEAENLPDKDKDAPGWRITSDTADLPVEIPAKHLRLDLRSPEGIVNCSGGHVLLGTVASLKPHRSRFFGTDELYEDFAKEANKVKGALVLAWASQRDEDTKRDEDKKAAAAPSYLTLKSDQSEPKSKLNLELVAPKGYPCSHDERSLAASLREAYGLPTLAAGHFDTAQPLVYGFLPLADGWLQLPLPNLPPINPASDREMIDAPTAAAASVLDGFLRFSSGAVLPPVFSAFDATSTAPLVSEAPWSVTLAGARGLGVAVLLGAGPARQPLFGQAFVEEPDLSARGLLWLSSDRPDALEALPRLGAGPGAYIDVPLEKREGGTGIFSVSIGSLKLSSTARGGACREEVDLAADFDAKYSDLPQWKQDERPVVSTTRWVRHPRMPLAAQMAMTRAATSAVRPLESRDLFPFGLQHDSRPNRCAEISWRAKDAFPALTGSWNHQLRPEWPRPKVEFEDDYEKTARGVAFVAFGVPGVEVAPRDGLLGDAAMWDMQAALRHDLPVLDEAFATATLPPLDVQAPAIDNVPAMTRVPTALDWQAMKTFWANQERRLQLSRVSHSYVIGYRAAGDTSTAAVTSLVGSFTWQAAKLGFTTAADNERLPYGWMSLGVGQPIKGNGALRGLEARFSVDAQHNTLTLDPQGSLKVLGNSPASLVDDNYVLDVRGAGVRPLEPYASHWWRPVRDRLAKVPLAGRLTRPPQQVIGIRWKAGGDERLRLWFKDLAFAPADAASNTSHEGEQAIDFTAWQDGRLQRKGHEWRLLPMAGVGECNGFDHGNDRLPFFGFAFEPLDLESMKFARRQDGVLDTVPDEVVLVGRLHLGPDEEDVHDGGNLLRLTLVRDGEALRLSTVALVNTDPLSFALRAGAGFVTVEAGEITLDKGALGLGKIALGFEFLEQPVKLQGATATLSPDKQLLTFDWHGEALDGHATIAITSATLVVGPTADKTTFGFTSKVSMAPGEAPGAPTVSITAPSGAAASLSVLGATVEGATFEPSRKAFCVVTKADSIHAGALLDGFPSGGKVHFGLIASVGPFDGNAVATLIAGTLVGTLSYAPEEIARASTFRVHTVRLRADCGRRSTAQGSPDTRWRGGMTLYGTAGGQSAIAWPDVSEVSAADWVIPYPESSSNGRTWLQVNAGHWHRHQVEWVLDGHELPFDTAGYIRAGDPAKGIWTTLALARHTLTPGDAGAAAATLSFTAVDSLALGAVAAIVPAWPAGAHGSAEDLVKRFTFGARYMSTDPDNTSPAAYEPGMIWPGDGGLGTVLQGSWGRAFRSAFATAYPEPAHGLLLLGGFVGLLDQGQPSAPLLRLPALIGVSAGLLAADGPAARPALRQGPDNPIAVELAWADGLASAAISVTAGSAVAPAGSHARDIDAAIAAGARALAFDVSAQRGLAAAMLVEQSFPIINEPNVLSTTPYFLAAAASVSRVLNAAVSTPQGSTPQARRALSLVSRASTDNRAPQPRVQRRAAVLVTSDGSRPSEQAARAPAIAAEMISVGEDLVVSDWPGLELGRVEQVNAQVAIRAASLHARPRAALLRDHDGRVAHVGLPRVTLAPRPRRPRVQRFADAGRGFMLPPVGGDEMGGVEEGISRPLRDDDGGSGIAGISRVVNLPALAAKTGPSHSDVRHVVWLAQQRVPVYLPLHTKLLAEPIPWLVPGAPRSRLPVDDQVLAALGEPPDQGQPSANPWQAFVPEQVAVTALSERPGILMARRLRLEIGANSFDPDGGAFDKQVPRFGQPAQSSASSPRTERTPRPAELPPNASLADRIADRIAKPAKPRLPDRRPCASPLLPTTNHAAWIGPADTVRGTGSSGEPWTVSFVAAQASAGVVGSVWDGSISLEAQLDLQRSEPAPQAPPAFWQCELIRVLGFRAKDTPLRATASLVIDGRALPYRWLRIQGAVGEALPDRVARGRVQLVLDMREQKPSDGQPGSPIAAIAEWLSSARTTPQVELRLTVHPGAGAQDPELPTDGCFELSTAGEALPGGPSRAPVTLRFPLWPVLRDRGGLAFEQSSLVFTDPAYDEGLSAPPHEQSGRVTLADASQLPGGRGALLAVLAADRARINRKGTLTLMADLRFEKRLEASVRAKLGDKFVADVPTEGEPATNFEPVGLALRLFVQPRAGQRRELAIAGVEMQAVKGRLLLGHVHELAVSSLVEDDGTPARLDAGDMLEVETTFPKGVDIEVLTVIKQGTKVVGKWKPVKLNSAEVRTLRVVLTDEPVVEPPPGLYAALVRKRDKEKEDSSAALSLPLYAQSPLPWRVDLQDAAADFRAGLMRRNATFVWTLPTTHRDIKLRDAHIVKCDRNGQTYLPDESRLGEDFIRARLA